VKGSNSVRFKDMIHRFKVYDSPRRPEGREEVWQGGERVDSRGTKAWPRWYTVEMLTNLYLRLLDVRKTLHTNI
jgi:hypothetical protein